MDLFQATGRRSRRIASMRDVFSDGLRNDANLLSARKFFEIFFCGPGDGHRVQFIVEVFKGVVSALEGNATG